MALYKCFSCGKEIKDTYVKRRVRCPHCGSKIVFKPRAVVTKVKAV